MSEKVSRKREKERIHRKVEKNCGRKKKKNGRGMTARRDKVDGKEKKEGRRMELYYDKNMYEKKIKELE